MIYLNYNNLDAATQEELLIRSKREVEQKIGDELKKYAKEHCLAYTNLLEEEAIKNLYNLRFVFHI